MKTMLVSVNKCKNPYGMRTSPCLLVYNFYKHFLLSDLGGFLPSSVLLNSKRIGPFSY